MKRFVAGLMVLALSASILPAQYPRLAPPPPCRSSGHSGLSTAYWAQGTANDLRPKIAVFSFEPDVDDAAKVHLAFSLPDRIRQRLAMDRGLIVATEWSVARALSDARARQDSAGVLLGADFLVTGRVTILGEQQEIEVELFRARTLVPIWRAAFRATSSLRAVEEAVVRGLSRALRLRQPPAMPAGWPARYEAHDAILAGDAYLRSTTRAGADSARAYYEAALAMEPGSPIAASRLARALVTVLERGGEIRGYPGTAGPRRINELIARALAVDSLSEPWTTRAMLARVIDPVRFAGALDAHLRAVSIDRNNADDEHEYGMTLLRLGDMRGAEARFRRALQLSPGRASTFAALAYIAHQNSRWESTCELANASIAAWPYDPLPYALRAEARLRLSDARHAYSDAEIVRRLSPGPWPDALRVLVAQGSSATDEARRLIRDVTASWLSPRTTLTVQDAKYLAAAYLEMGDRRRAIEALRRARPPGADLKAAIRNPRLAAIQRDTAVVRILAESEGRNRE